MKRYPIFVAAMFLAACTFAATVDVHYTVLHGTQAEKALQQCSRPTVEGITGIWDPSEGDIRQLEIRLPDLAQLVSTNRHGVNGPIGDPRTTHRQYIGVVAGGRHYIYVNAWDADEFMLQKEKDAWRHVAYVVCDGGPSHWGVLYDPQTGKFSALEGNGEA
jgi:hypothetical protein